MREIEAINILNGYNVSDYIVKYERIQNLIPTIYKVMGQNPDEDDYGKERD